MTKLILRAMTALSIMTASAAPNVLTAQSVGQIGENPDLVKLREIWRVVGNRSIKEEVALAADALGRLAPNEFPSWAVYAGKPRQWRVYRGSVEPISTTPFWTFDSASRIPRSPVVGDFLGNDGLSVGFGRTVWNDDSTKSYQQLHIFGVNAGAIATTPTLVYDPRIECIVDMVAADLDGDGADELVAARTCEDFPEIMIYRGGAGFQVETPAVRLGEPLATVANANYRLAVADIDGDRIADLLSGSRYSEGWTINLYLSSQGAPWTWTQPHRTLFLAENQVGPNPMLSLHDVNGDGVKDLAGSLTSGADAGLYVWLSGVDKSPLIRPYDRDDADVRLKGTNFKDWHIPMGPANSSKGYAMLPIIYVTGSMSTLRAFSGGPKGPNGTYDGWYVEGMGPFMGTGGAVGDVNGDGWDDYLNGNSAWTAGSGIALILAGGPHIPIDTLEGEITGVREEPIAGEKGGLFLWPNPIVDELNIAWRGNLKSMPHRFTINDMLGREIAAGSVDPSVGAARWSCADAPSGAYALSVYDDRGTIIATATVVKR